MPVPVEGYLHPLDLSARRQLESVPLLQKVTQTYVSRITERSMRQQLFSEAVRLGPRQFPEYYRLLPPLCHALGMPEPPLFLWEDDGLNASSYGQTRPVITLGLALVKALEPDEIQAVLAHECGHISTGRWPGRSWGSAVADSSPACRARSPSTPRSRCSER